jgi:hypothetical protein
VYVTDSRLISLTYAVRGYPNLFTTLPNGKEVFLEVVLDLFKKMVKGKKVYIYTLEEKEYKEVQQNKRCGHSNCYSYDGNVQVIQKEYIEDAYKEFMKYIENGEFLILKEENMPNKDKIIQDVLKNKDKVDFTNKENYLDFLVTKKFS